MRRKNGAGSLEIEHNICTFNHNADPVMNRLPILNWTKFILVAITIFGDHVSFGQFRSLPDSNSLWVSRAYDQFNVFDVSTTYYLESVDHDTLINDTVYSFLYGYNNFGSWPGEFAGGIYDNGSGQVYYFHPSSDHAYILYDFDVLPGDSVEGVWAAGGGSTGQPITMYIASVDTVVIGGRSLKRIGIQSWAAILGNQGVVHWWIQGIGGTNGLLVSFGSLVLDVSSGLECMSSNDTTWWSWGSMGFPGVCSATSTFDVLGDPRPPGLTLVSAGLYMVNYPVGLSIEVYSIAGALVYEDNGLRFDLRQQPPGIYIVRLRDKEYVWSQKIVR